MGVQVVFINGPFSFILVVFLNPHKQMFNRLTPCYTLIGNFLPQWTVLNNTIWCEHEHEQMRSPNMFPCQSLINAICFKMCNFTPVHLFEIGCHYKVFFSQIFNSKHIYFLIGVRSTNCICIRKTFHSLLLIKFYFSNIVYIQGFISFYCSPHICTSL